MFTLHCSCSLYIVAFHCTLLLFTLICSCSLYHAPVHCTLHLFTQHCSFSRYIAPVHSTLHLFTLHCSCSLYIAPVHSALLLFTLHCTCSLHLGHSMSNQSIIYMTGFDFDEILCLFMITSLCFQPYFRSIWLTHLVIVVIKLWPDLDAWRPSRCHNTTSNWLTDMMLVSS